jgi:hypothetical protein
VAAEAQATKPVLTNPLTILKPVEPAADSSAVQTLATPTASQAAEQQAQTKQAKAKSAAAPTISSTDSQDTIATKENSSSVTVLPSPKSSTQETTTTQTTNPNALVSKIKSWFKSLMAFELEVTISF